MFIDTHCHIHDVEFYPDNREDVYRRSIEADVQMICVGTSEADSRAAVEFASMHQNVWSLVGVHPHDTKNGVLYIEQILKNAHQKVVGIGEIGLDYFYDNSPRNVQVAALEQQLQWASDYNLPVSFHVREAFDDFWPIFDNFSSIRGVLHSYTDTQANVDEASKRGLYVGLNGISTFTKDPKQIVMYDELPLDRLLLETDAPFLTPVPFRGKINEPALVRSVAEFHANRRKLSIDEVAAVTTQNAQRLFNL